jgi:IS5 family transposase
MYAISDDELEFLNDRISFMEFLGLGIEDPIPDAKTVWLFRDNLAKHDLVKEVLAQFDDYLREKGYTVAVGQMVDATLIPVPVQRNTRQENKEVKEGKIPQQWAENPHVLRQKDRDARWLKKNGISYFGYKNHIGCEIWFCASWSRMPPCMTRKYSVNLWILMAQKYGEIVPITARI